MSAAPQLAALNLSEHGQVRIAAPTSFKGTNDPEEFQDFKFRLKMYLGVTRPNLVQNMTRIENDSTIDLSDFDALPDDVKAEGRILLAVLGTCCIEAAGSFVRNFVEVEGHLHGLLLWQRLCQRFTLRRNLTTLGQFEHLMQWELTEKNVRTELPRWEAALIKLEREIGPIDDTLNIGLLRKNLGPSIQHYLRLNPTFLTDFQAMKDLIIEWDRFQDFSSARPTGSSSSTSGPAPWI